MHAWNPANYLNLVDFSNFPLLRCVKWKPNNKHRLFARKFHMFLQKSWKYSICHWKQDGNRPGLVYFFWCRFVYAAMTMNSMVCLTVSMYNILRFQIMTIELIGKDDSSRRLTWVLGCNSTTCVSCNICVWCLKWNDMIHCCQTPMWKGCTWP